MSRTSRAAVITLAVALVAELGLERALLRGDVVGAILGAEPIEPAGLLALYVVRLTLLLTVALSSYRLSSWACRRAGRAS